MKRKLFYTTVLIIFVVIIIYQSNLYYRLRSYVIMYPYNLVHRMQSIQNKKGLELDVPGGMSTNEKDWYPFVMNFNSNEGFSNYIDKDLSLTILYNFGHFQSKYSSSSYYNPNSPFYSSFYGGYIVYNNENPKDAFGFNDDGSINIQELSLIPRYDQTKLVLPSIGCPSNKIIFKSNIDNIERNINYIGINNWVKINTTIRTNSPVHKYTKDYNGYIQYGKPIKDFFYNKEYPIITLKGRMYVKYLEEYDVTVALYIMSPDYKTIEKYDKIILSKSIIK